MDYEAMYVSRYVRAADLKREVTLAIANVRPETVGKEQKPVVYFTGAKKALVLNRTNGEALRLMFGRDTSTWIGKRVTLHVVKISDPFSPGRTTLALRVRGSPDIAGPMTAEVQRGRKTISVAVEQTRVSPPAPKPSKVAA